MSAPDTNVEREAKRHKPALGGIGFSLIVVALLVAVFGLYAISGWDDAIEDNGTPATQEQSVTGG